MIAIPDTDMKVSLKVIVLHDPQVKLEENIINCNNNLKEEIVNLKDIVINRLQDENERLRAKCSNLENKVVTLEQNLNSLGQYGRRNNN